MLKTARILLEAKRMKKFSVKDLAKAADSPESTVHTTLGRHQTWFNKTQIDPGSAKRARGGQPSMYEVSEIGDKAITELLARLPQVDVVLGEREPSNPVGLDVARSAAARLAGAKNDESAFLKGVISENLSWAKRELEGASDTAALRSLEEIRRLLDEHVQRVPAVSPASKSPGGADFRALANELADVYIVKMTKDAEAASLAAFARGVALARGSKKVQEVAPSELKGGPFTVIAVFGSKASALSTQAFNDRFKKLNVEVVLSAGRSKEVAKIARAFQAPLIADEVHRDRWATQSFATQI